MTVVWRYGWGTDAGRVRSRNEDAACVLPDHGLVVLADGLGGHPAGDRASRMAVEVVADLEGGGPQPLEAGDPQAAAAFLARQVIRANAHVLAEALRDPASFGMATTLVAGLFLPHAVVIAHVGDSRAYRLRAGALECATRDHNLLEERLSAGDGTREALARRADASQITRVVGVQPGVTPDVRVWDAQLGDRWLLCTDGLHGTVPEARVAGILGEVAAGPKAQVDALVREANALGGPDNVTVAVVHSGD